VTDPATVSRSDVDGVLLDADDTLYDTRSAMHAAGATAAAALWPDADPERVRRAGERFRDDPGGHFHAYARGELEFGAMRRARVADLARWLGQPVDDGLWGAFEAVYEPAFLAAMASFDDVRPAVTALRASGLAVGVLTNSSGTYTDLKMRASGLEGLFEVVCTRDTLGFGKPDPRAFREACRRLATPPGRTLYVGDDLETDPLAAVDAGMPAAWLVRGGTPDPDAARRAGERGVPAVASLADVVALPRG
jgi:putative hydrolase of the HAD superfamily